MGIFQKKQNSLVCLKEEPFCLEREIQRLFEENLDKIAGLKLVKSEFSIQNQRLDTLAFDTENNSFVIIEYKKGHNYSVFDQGVAYLNTLLRFKVDFVLEYNETLGEKLKKNEVDWSQSKIVFVSPAFNQNQKQAVDFNDINIELWEIKRFENNIIFVDRLKKTSSAPSIKLSGEAENSKLGEIVKEIKTYSEQDHLTDKSDEVQELYQEFKQAILNLSPEVEITPQKIYIAFKKGNKNIADIQIQNKGLKIGVNKKQGELEDPKKIMRDVSKIGHWTNGDYQVFVEDTKNLEYIMSLVKQCL